MNSIWWQIAGWTMIHFLWIGSLVFLASALVRLVLFRAAPQWRYAASLLGLAVLAFSPPMIVWRLASEVEPVVATTVPVAIVAPDRYEIPPIDTISPAEISQPAVIDLKYRPLEAPAVVKSIEPAGPEPVVTVSPPIAPTMASIEPTVDPLSVFHTLPSYLPWLWMIGTPATLLLLATGLMGSERLRRRAEPIADPVLLETLARLTAALRIGRQVSLAVSDRVLQPVLVGIVRPLVLLPSVALTSWSPEEIEMALVHELSHVRRWDNLVNLLQRLVESLLFFHPAVWITSRWVRADREHCCDAVVVAHCGNREAYASLLVSVAKSSVTRRLPSPAMAMASHPLTKRVRRILQLEDDPMLVSKRTLLSVAVLLAALTAGAVWSSTLAEETKGEPEASVSEDVMPGGKDGTTEGTEDAEKSPDDKWPVVFEMGMSPLIMTAQVVDLTHRGKKCFITMGAQIQIYYEGLSVHCNRVEVYPDRIVASDGKDTVELKVTPRDAQSAGKLPFLSLEDQRIADLAYGMLGVEVAAIDAEELAAVKEKGFSGGVRVEDVPGRGGGFVAGAAATNIVPGDVFVGLHIWPTADFDELAEVLRRGDLNQFTPLKYFVLRQGIRTEYVKGSSPEAPQMPVEVPSGQWTLHTGRIAFDNDKWRVEQQRLKQIELKAEQEAGETKLLPLPGQPGAVKMGPAEPPTAVASEPEITPPIATTPIAEPAEAEPIKPAPPQLLYDGRTFDDWRTEWKTELKTEKRTAAIAALAAFGRAGDGNEAAETILDVAGEYDPGRMHSPESLKNLKEAILSVMTGGLRFLPTNDWVELLLARVDEAETDEQRERCTGWLVEVMNQSRTSSPEMQEALLDLVAKIGEIPNSEQSKRLREQAIISLVRSDYELQNEQVFQLVKSELNASPPNTGLLTYTRFRFLDRLPEQVELLLHPDNTVRSQAQFAFADLGQQEGSPEVFKTLLNILKDPKRADAHAAAIAAIQAGVRQLSGGPVNAMYYTIQDALTEVMGEGEEALVRPAAAALGKIEHRSETIVMRQAIKKESNMSEERKQYIENELNEMEGRRR